MAATESSVQVRSIPYMFSVRTENSAERFAYEFSGNQNEVLIVYFNRSGTRMSITAASKDTLPAQHDAEKEWVGEGVLMVVMTTPEFAHDHLSKLFPGYGCELPYTDIDAFLEGEDKDKYIDQFTA